MKDVFACWSHECVDCNVDPVVLMPGYKGSRIACPVCGKSTSAWWRLDDAWLEWNQIVNKEEDR